MVSLVQSSDVYIVSAKFCIYIFRI